jgi:DNA primase catalytic core
VAVTYKDLKDKKYLEPTKSFLKDHLKIRFLNSKGAYCPFHDDNTDSFRIYIDGKDEIRFHCFGACEADWDIYDLIMLKENCTFRQAQAKFATYLGTEDLELHKVGERSFQASEAEEGEAELDELIVEIDTEDLTDKHREALRNAVLIYNELLLSRKEKFHKTIKYLESRGVDEEAIKKFNIGFCPGLSDEEFKGRALLNSVREELMDNLLLYQVYRRTSLLFLLNDETLSGYKYYRRFIDYTDGSPFGVYSDYFQGRITFPVYSIDGQIEGIVGRRLDNRGVRWLKQRQEDTFVRPKNWLYGIDKSCRGMKEYQTAIIVEGIFDFFAFYNISENTEKPIIISTLGTAIQPSTVRLLRDLGVKHLIVAFDWDEAGLRGIKKATSEIKHIEVSFLGSLKEGEDPADRLKGVLGKLSNFGIRHLQKAMQVESPSGKPVMASLLVQRKEKSKQFQDEILLKPASALADESIEQAPKEPSDFWYRKEDILPLLSYDHKNRAELDQKLDQIRLILGEPLKDPPPEEVQDQYLHLPPKFIEDEYHLHLGDALILHLRLAIEQQSRKRKITETDATIAQWLKTSRRNVQKYKAQLKEAGVLNIKKQGIRQTLSVNYFKKREEVEPIKA